VPKTLLLALLSNTVHYFEAKICQEILSDFNLLNGEKMTFEKTNRKQASKKCQNLQKKNIGSSLDWIVIGLDAERGKS